MALTNNRVALITGASRGLGLETARALARRGWSLVINGRNEQALEAARRQLPGEGEVLAVSGDIALGETRARLRVATSALGRLDFVMNNASSLGATPLPPLLDYPLDTLQHLFATNALAPLALLQELRPLLRPGAAILNVSSDAAVEAYPGWGGYGASKAALEQISAVLAAENPDLRVYAVDPGDMRTQMHQDAFPGEDISDRPLPETSVPGILALVERDFPSGRYLARALREEAVR
jgi:NAD(P)-dependent dehydrogenase (short-subunit alcohol dehydrogenase family)